MKTFPKFIYTVARIQSRYGTNYRRNDQEMRTLFSTTLSGNCWSVASYDLCSWCRSPLYLRASILIPPTHTYYLVVLSGSVEPLSVGDRMSPWNWVTPPSYSGDPDSYLGCPDQNCFVSSSHKMTRLDTTSDYTTIVFFHVVSSYLLTTSHFIIRRYVTWAIESVAKYMKCKEIPSDDRILSLASCKIC
jgi:hypothetical protein